ncbi:MAG: lipopolysaccharide kinase InaA family protein [Prevotellaceae bacterium]|nr:lipopolysaccharide kinase InaA family protein [Prevotellaceae bacterium]
MIRMQFLSTRYQQYRDFLLALPARMDREGEYVYGGKRNLIKRFTAPDGEQLIVKRFHRPRFLNIFVYSWGLRKPKGQRACRYATILRQHHIDTPEPVAYLEDRHGGLLRESWLITLQCPYRHLLYEMGTAAPEVYEPVAHALAAFTAHMHDEGILHKDFSPGNILWDNDSHGQVVFSIVDINRMFFGAVDIHRGCANFARLWGPQPFIELLVRDYARRRHFNEEEAVAIALKARRKFWTRYLRHHEKPYPM